jgi:hypothetical protein
MIPLAAGVFYPLGKYIHSASMVSFGHGTQQVGFDPSLGSQTLTRLNSLSVVLSSLALRYGL